jgi:L-ribulose-5-phosphate 3-epimerase UlaE
VKKLIISLLVGGALLAACSLPEETTTDTSAKEGKISKGAGTKDATADVKLVSFKKVDHGYGFVEYVGVLQVVNHSEKSSDYYIEISIENKAGDNIGWSNAVVEHLKPGQKAKTEFSSVDKGAYKAVIHEIQRTEAI